MADYIEINQTDIELTMANGLPDVVGTFTQCPGETMEFHLALADEAGTNGSTGLSSAYTVTKVSLKADTNEVVSSNVADGVVRGHQHTLFYKFGNNSMAAVVYTIEVEAVVIGGGMMDTRAMIKEQNLQWGYRTYGEGYVLDTMANANPC